MFKKQYTTKTHTTLRGSDRRKLRALVFETYLSSVSPPSQPEPNQAESTSEPAATSTPDHSLADLLVPEGIRSTKFVTSGGTHGLLYTSAENEPLWFADSYGDSTPLPTVYTLWTLPFLPIIATAPVAIESLVEGSDLFIPGVFTMSSTSMPAGSVVAIASAQSPSVPLAVGKMALDAKDIKENDKGKAVEVLHTWKDTLWSGGTKVKPPANLPSFAEAVAQHRAQITQMSEQTKEFAELSVAETNGAAGPSNEGPAISSEDADAILREAFLHCLLKMSQSPSLAPDLPMSSSTFYSSYILPNRRFRPSSTDPSYDSLRSHDLMKRSSYKKLSKFLAVLDKEGLMRIKTIQKPSPDTLIIALDWMNPAVHAHAQHVKSIRDYRVVGEEEERRERREKAGKDRDDASAKAVQVTELWKIYGKEVSAFFDQAYADQAEKGEPVQPKEYFTGQELKAFLDAYIASNELVHPRDKSHVVLASPSFRSPLADVVIPKSILKKPKGDAAAPTPGASDELVLLKREDLVPRVRGAMQAWYEIRRGGEDPVRKKGKLEPISVDHARRAGRKDVTLITGFEPYGIDGEAFAEQLRKKCAGSTSVGPKAAGGGALEILVQGQHGNTALELLLAEGVPAAHVKGDIKAPKKKK